MDRYEGGVFLKRIEMLGFKSFASRTSIEFVDGITALLGPNGCGKSNIVDAFKWVMGEQSVRNMRAERMEDVIFSGSERRKALSAAEVTITIANDEGLLESERPEIAIKRRIFRDGESEYFLNGMLTRLKELRELFHDTGIGKSVYSVIEQGRIDQILSSKPGDLRCLFEEAAGISRYRARGIEAERKLNRTEENMRQVEGILREVGRNYESLKKQSDKVQEYRRLQKIVFSLERNLKLIKLRELESGREKKKKKFQSHQKKYSKLIGKIDEMKAALVNELASVKEMKSKLVEYQKMLYGMDLKKENQESLIHGFREQIDEAEGNFDSIKIRRQKLLDVVHSLEKLKKSRENELSSSHERFDRMKISIDDLVRIIESAKRHLKENSYEIKKTSERLSAEERCGEELGEELRAITDEIVSELDRVLGESGYDGNKRFGLGGSISELISKLRIRAEDSSRLFIDKKNPASSAETLELLRRGAKNSLVLKQSAEELSRLFSEYRQSDFLEEFLAPEGVITRKRNLDERIVASVSRLRELRGKLDSLSKGRIGLETEIAKRLGELEELRVAQARIDAQAAAARDSLFSLARESDSENARLKEIQLLFESEKTRIQSLDMKLSVILSQGEELKSEKTELRREIVKLEEGINTKNKKVSNWENSLEQLNIRGGKTQLEGEKLRMEIDYRDEEIKILLKDFRDRYSRDLTDLANIVITKSPGEIKEALLASKVELKELGQVNLMAPEDFAEVSERYDFLSCQLKDLGKAKNDLAVVTEKLREESVNLFLQTYRDIWRHFHEIFRLLFGGGRAEIRLINREDPLNSGLEIYVQPPGKKLGNISLLSGGERSLCGIALMFAIFQVKPSPVYILDEIDASLDEANIQRFLNLLLDSGRGNQFLLITHNKKTISCAANLLGVTMQEPGVSSIVGLKLEGQERKIDEEPIAVGQ